MLLVLKVILLVVVSGAQTESKTPVSAEAQLALNKVHQKIVAQVKSLQLYKTLELSVVRGNKPEQILYGNERIGFFKASDWEVKNGKLIIRFLPPTYSGAISFYTLANNKKTKLYTTTYRAPLWPEQFLYNPVVTGRTNIPFILTNIGVSLPQATLYYPIIINSLGELLWVFAEASEKIMFIYPPSLKVFKNGDLLIMGRRWQSSLLRATISGEILRREDYASKGRDYFFTHPVFIDEANSRILAFTYDCRSLSRWQDPSPVFSGLFGFFRRFYLPRRSILGSRLIEIEAQNLIYKKELWNSFQSFNPKKDRNLAMDSSTGDRFLFITEPHDYYNFLQDQAPFGDEKYYCDSEWLHENNIQYIPGKGYLLSLKTTSKIVLLDESARSIVWSLGADEDSTFKLSFKETFYQQHAAFLDKNDTVFLLDNGGQTVGQRNEDLHSRVLGINLNFTETKAKITYSHMFNMRFKQVLRGDISLLSDTEMFVYLPGSYSGLETYRVIDLPTNKNSYTLSFWRRYYNKNIRAVPLYGLGNDQMVERSPLKKHAPGRSDVSDSENLKQKVIDYSY